MSILEAYHDHFLPEYSNYPQARYVSLFLLRQVQSEAIFRTEGSGEPLSKEFVHAGKTADEEPIQRVVISKRKQTAVERRTGRELLRRHDLLFVGDGQDSVCALNRNNPCGKCMDCMIYGYAAGGGGAQKSRVITDDAFSLHPAATIVGAKQFNALYDNSTMRDPETGEPSTSIGTDEYVKPEAIFLDIETLKDLTAAEFQYVLGNILRSTRYGAISSRIGKIENHLVGVAFSDCELFSNLEWTRATYDALRNGKGELDFPTHVSAARESARATIDKLLNRVVGTVTMLTDEEVVTLRDEARTFYGDDAAVKEVLDSTTGAYPNR